MTICNTCTLNLLDAHAAFLEEPGLGETVNARLSAEGLRYSGRTRISHFLWVLYEDIGLDRLRELVVTPLNGLSVAAFYGCHITRPPQRYGFVDSRNNIALERLAELLAASPSTTADVPSAADSIPPPMTSGLPSSSPVSTSSRQKAPARRRW